MEEADLPAVMVLAAVLHPAYPEDPPVFAERLRLAPGGCCVAEEAGTLCAYLISHPWRLGRPPKLNRLLGGLPKVPDCWYVHDLAVSVTAWGLGLGTVAFKQVRCFALEADFSALELIAVSGSVPFWRRQGFSAVPKAGAEVASYGPEALLMRWDLRDSANHRL